jgi:hypothetical protein
MKVLQKLKFWRKDGEAKAADPLPISRPNPPPAIDISETPDEAPYREDRPGGSVSKAEEGFQKKLFEE